MYNDFTEDEIACLKKMIYKFRQNEILELYNKRTAEEWKLSEVYRTTVSGCLPRQTQVSKSKSFLVKAKDAIINFFKKDPRWY